MNCYASTTGDAMKATIEVELQPFQVPNFVRPVAKPGLQ
jgi:hypothetical protein